jgi:tetratricopeptide (TPR) repeat protein
MAPEQLRGEPPSIATDIYSAGVALYELATGHRPFVGSQADVIEGVLHRDPKPASEVSHGVPRWLDAIVMKAMHKLPEMRYHSARALLDDLEHHGAGLQASPPRARVHVGRRTALVAALLLAGTAAVWRLIDAGTGSVSAFKARGWVVVADFDSRTADAIMTQTVQESLTIALQQSAYVNVMPRDQVFDALRRMARKSPARLDQATGLDLCEREGAQLLLAGSVAESGGTIQVNVSGIESPGRTTTFTESVRFSKREDLFGKVDELARAVRQRLGESQSAVQQASAPLARVTTGSLDALRQYTLASDALARGALDDAQPLLEEALKLDPDFAIAHRAIARVYSTQGQRALELQHLQRAYDLRANVTSRERQFIEGAYYAAHERYSDAAASYAALATAYPDDADAQYELAVSRDATGETDKAIAALEEELRIRPRSVRGHETLVLLLAKANRNEEALRLCDKAVADGRLTPRLQWGRGMALFGLGRLDEARREFAALETSRGTHAAIGRVYQTRADLYEGRLRPAIATLAGDVDEDLRQGRTSAALLRHYLLGRAWLQLGDLRRARLEADRIRDADAAAVKATNLRHAAVLYARAGDVAPARALLRRLEVIAADTRSSFPKGTVWHVRGEIALAEHQPAQAVDHFTRALAEYPGSLSHAGLARAYEALGDHNAAAREWQAVIDSRGEILRDGYPPDWTLAHLARARLLDRAGAPSAADEYRSVLAVWRGADPLSLVREPTEALRRLDAATRSPSTALK